MRVSLKEEGPPSSATEIDIGGMSTGLMRRSASPVTHMLEPPLISGRELSRGTSLTEVVSAPERPHTQGEAEMYETLATNGGEAGRGESLLWPTEQE